MRAVPETLGSEDRGVDGSAGLSGCNRATLWVAARKRLDRYERQPGGEDLMASRVVPWLVVAASLLVAGAFATSGTTAAADQAGLLARAARPGSEVIARAWHGKTLREKADEYEKYLTDAVTKFPSIPGNLGYQVMRLDGGPDGDAYVEFQVISYWESLEAIKAYAGADVRRTRSLPRDPEYLVKLEPFVRNYELRVNAISP
jgi:heme-degrading monooxygenase HmoA